MNRETYRTLLPVAFLSLSFLTNCSSNSSSSVTPLGVVITATSGSGQSATVGTAFTKVLVATVMSNGSPANGVTVTFAAPASGASGTFAGGVNTAMTNVSGVAMSAAFTATTTAGAYVVTATATDATTPASFSLTNTAGPPATLTAWSGSGQSTAASAPFAFPLSALVVDSDSNPVGGVAVTFTCPPGTPASCSFTSGQGSSTATEIVPSGTNGIASATPTANTGTGGYTVTAAAAGIAAPADFTVTNISSNTYVFYLSGADTRPASSGRYNFYALAGSVTIDGNGNVLEGEQDYNDANGLTSPAGGDRIVSGTLTFVPPSYTAPDDTGQGTLYLNTNNQSMGSGGTEILAVQFVNNNHALVTQYDGTATSSGSMDMSTRSGTVITGGSYAFTLSGVDSGYNPAALGGVFTISSDGLSLQNGLVDTNDYGKVMTDMGFSAAASATDSFGRGTITGIGIGGTAVSLVYYIVGPEVIRIIDVDANDSLVGSAFGQGTSAGTFTNASLGRSVFGIAGNSRVSGADALGQFSTSNMSSNPADFSGVADANELAKGISPVLAAPISGTYSIPSTNGYGNLNITSGNLGDLTTLGIYLTDPSLNLSDPNNPNGGGGALLLDLDDVLAGVTGVLVPQTGTTAADFNGNYAVGWQDFNDFNSDCTLCEFNIVAQGPVTGGASNAFSFTGFVSDPFSTIPGSGPSYFNGTPLADPVNPGRYSMLQTNVPSNPLAVKVGTASATFDVVIYQANAGQLFWVEVDQAVFFGPLERQGALTGLPAAKKPAVKTQPKQKQ
jgi:hypothetical protein